MGNKKIEYTLSVSDGECVKVSDCSDTLASWSCGVRNTNLTATLTASVGGFYKTLTTGLSEFSSLSLSSFPFPLPSHSSSAQVTCNRATWGICRNQVVITPNFSPGGVENGWKYTIPPLLDSPDLLVVDIRPDGMLGALRYSAVFDKDLACSKSLGSPKFTLSLTHIANNEGDDEGGDATESVIEHPSVLVAVRLGSVIVVGLILPYS